MYDEREFDSTLSLLDAVRMNAQKEMNVPTALGQTLNLPQLFTQLAALLDDETPELEDGEIFEPQMGSDDFNIHKISNTMTYENVAFGDQHDPYVNEIESNFDPTRKLLDTSDATLENFFSRPIKISEVEWSTSTNLGFNFDPWSLYFDNPRVANRIANFKLLRAKLHLKVVVNGNGFQYGRAIAAYQPFYTQDDLSSHASLINADLVGTSQLPHVFIDPTTSTAGELILPMFHYKNYLDITNSEWSDLGRIFVRSLNDLKHANGATDVVTVSTFAWAEEVSMSVLTSVEPTTMGPQKGEEPDEFEIQMGDEVDEANAKGVVSGPATTVAKWASYFTAVPYLEPFAMATSMIANTVAGVAKIFGYCRPPVTKNPEPYRPTPASSLALTNVPDNVQKLTVDDKQELTIDPRIAGLGGADPLNIKSIAAKESYLTKFTWAIGTAPETLLWNARVTPVTWAEGPVPPTSFHFPACAFAALPFKYWTGTMKFRFQIVASSFHKGRIKIVYDPEYLATNEYNTNYLKIVDIADEQDFTISVGPGQEYTLMDHHRPGIEPVTQLYSTTPYAFSDSGNGVIGVYIVNELTTPNSTVNNDIEVNVFVSAGDDFEVFVPDNHFQKFVFKPQSGEEIEDFEPQSGLVTEEQNTSEPSAPEQTKSDVVGMPESNDPNVNKVFTGEAINSFRTMLKRYNLHSAIWVNDSSTIKMRFPIFPYLRGNVIGAIDTTGALATYNYCNTVLLHWVRNAYSGWRGSIRYKLLARYGSSGADNIYVERSNWVPTAGAYRYIETPLDVSTNINKKKFDVLTDSTANGRPDQLAGLTGVSGSAFAHSGVNPITEFEVPYYSNLRFTPGKQQDYNSVMSLNPGGFDMTWESNVTNAKGSTRDIHVAAGEDFQVYFFTGLPRVYYEVSAPAP